MTPVLAHGGGTNRGGKNKGVFLRPPSPGGPGGRFPQEIVGFWLALELVCGTNFSCKLMCGAGPGDLGGPQGAIPAGNPRKTEPKIFSQTACRYPEQIRSHLALELVCGADFPCKLMCGAGPGDLGGSRGSISAGNPMKTGLKIYSHTACRYPEKIRRHLALELVCNNQPGIVKQHNRIGMRMHFVSRIFC